MKIAKLKNGFNFFVVTYKTTRRIFPFLFFSFPNLVYGAEVLSARGSGSQIALAESHAQLFRLHTRAEQLKQNKLKHEEIVRAKTQEIYNIKSVSGATTLSDQDAQKLAAAIKAKEAAEKALNEEEPANAFNQGEDKAGIKTKLNQTNLQISESKVAMEGLQKAHDAVVKLDKTGTLEAKGKINEIETAVQNAVEARKQLEEGRGFSKHDPDGPLLQESNQTASAVAEAHLADLTRPFDPAVMPTPLVTSSPTNNSPIGNTSSLLDGSNSQLRDIQVVSQGRASAGPELSNQMNQQGTRFADSSLSGTITGASNGNWRSNEGNAFVNGQSVPGRFFEDQHGGGRYFVPTSAYNGGGLDGYMRSFQNNPRGDLSGLHQLNGTIASGGATRAGQTGNNIRFDGFYNGTQAFQNTAWNAPTGSGLRASAGQIPFPPPPSRTVAVTPPSNTSTPPTFFSSLSNAWTSFQSFWRGR